MGQIRERVQGLSLRKSLVLYIAVFTLLALFLSAATSVLCGASSDAIRSAYPPSGERYYLTTETGERLGEGTYIGEISAPLSERDEQIIFLLEIAPAVLVPVYSALCIIAAALLFYRDKLKAPLAELQAASQKIAENNLDFTISRQGRDELGRLCASFEIMRAALAENLSEMWRQTEARRQLNAAFAHELRTPLTVIKGYNEMLRASENASTRETAATMQRHITRMESYVNSMSRLQRLEDAQPDAKLTELQPFLAVLHESAEMVCTKSGKRLQWKNNAPAIQVCIDTGFLSQTADNLVSNAARYAKGTVTLSVRQQRGGLQIIVSDDGPGFREDGLQNVVKPYFSEESREKGHFGLGLYIAKLLCERHGGSLQIGNTPTGAKAAAFFKFSASVDKK